jgi:hypothetical protein
LCKANHSPPATPPNETTTPSAKKYERGARITLMARIYWIEQGKVFVSGIIGFFVMPFMLIYNIIQIIREMTK